MGPISRVTQPLYQGHCRSPHPCSSRGHGHCQLLHSCSLQTLQTLLLLALLLLL